MKKLLFILLLCGCATVKPSKVVPEVVLELPQPKPQKQLAPLPAIKLFATEEHIIDIHDKMLANVSYMYVYSTDLVSGTSNNLEYARRSMLQIVDSIKPGIDMNMLLDRMHLINLYMQIITDVAKFNAETFKKIQQLNDKTDSELKK